MPAFVHLVRHAQGVHNLSAQNQQLPDPELTPLGKQQCTDLCRSFPFQDEITHLVASPMRRTIYTCLYSFRRAVDAGKVVLALPEIQEVSALPCDIGSAPQRLRVEFGPSKQVDLSRVAEEWCDKSPGGRFAPEMDKLDTRAREARQFFRELVAAAEGRGAAGDVHIVAVTHGGFLHFLTQDWDGIAPERGTGWANTEWRSYEFADPAGRDSDARLKETLESWRRRKGDARPLTDTEHVQLRAAYQEKLQSAVDDDSTGST
ncbi:hypothetical protein P8C59_008885 [Phyllachora maydis]|uniref:Phosphoglycerate mutase family protein n=1 Tax=Phyllachora maydis TaxID=1825666 RepID=A0AAD9IC08_9PEZI|nr:hypothetical protein P8C59_008885 [Phyllachora maydis]